MDNEETIFLENVLFLRKSNRLTKKEMASILGISMYHLNKVEQGVLPECLGIEVVFRIEKYFKIKATEQFSKRLKK